MQSPGFRLIMRRGPQPNQQFDLTRDTITIGRDITNDIVINDPEVSRHHSRLTRTMTGYMLEDLRSTNGSFVNRQRITGPVQLNSGDILGLGETVTLVYEGLGAPAAETLAGSGGSAAPVYSPAPGQLAYSAPAAAPVAPPPMPEEEEAGFDRNRWIVIGCAVLTVLFCCTIVAAGIFIDTYDDGRLWCEIPVISTEILNCP